MKLLKRAWVAIDRFFYEPSSPLPMAMLRVSIAAVLILQWYMLSGKAVEFFGRHGIIQTALTDRFIADGIMPRLYDLTDWLTVHRGWSERTGIEACGGLYLASLVCVLVGFQTRVASTIACFFHALFLTTGYYSAYGVDRFTQICLFYFILMPVSGRLTLLGRKAGPSAGATVSLRVMQLHLCVAYFASGIEKLVGIQWRNGEAVFRAMMLPSFNQFDVLWLAHYPLVCKALCWGTLVLEIGYPLMIWNRRTRRAWILGIESLHLGIGLFMGLYLFGSVMALLTFCAFGAPLLLQQHAKKTVVELGASTLAEPSFS